MGCFVNNPWNSEWPPYRGHELSVPHLGLTGPEKECLKHLVEAWSLFVEMDNKHPQDNAEFCKAIHDAQKMLALRVARRVDTDVWSQWPKEHLPTDPIT